MAGRGFSPKPNGEKAPRSKPERGPLIHATAVGWQHGETPACPDELCEDSQRAWVTWFGAWFASFWTPVDLPGLEHTIRLYDKAIQGAASYSPDLRLWMETYGITPKGQQDRRWRPPTAESLAAASGRGATARHPSRYAHLGVVGDGPAG